MVLFEEITEDSVTGVLSTTSTSPRAPAIVESLAMDCEVSKTEVEIIPSTEIELGTGAEAEPILEALEKQSQPLTTFTCFSKLPPELRINIWKRSLPGSRTMHLSIPQGSYYEVRWKPFRQPAALNVCHESRTEALKRYRLMFASSIEPAPAPALTASDDDSDTESHTEAVKRYRLIFASPSLLNVPPQLQKRVYFDPQTDIISFSGRINRTMVLMDELISEEDLSAVKHIQIPLRAIVQDWELFSISRPQIEDITLAPLLPFHNLEKIVVVIRCSIDFFPTVVEEISNPDAEKPNRFASQFRNFRRAVIALFQRHRVGDEAFEGVEDVEVVAECESAVDREGSESEWTRQRRLEMNSEKSTWPL